MLRELNLKIGDILLEQGIIDRDQLKKALKYQKEQKPDQKRLGNYLINLNYATEDQVTNALALQFNLPVIHLDDLVIKREIIDKLPVKLSKRFNVIPVFKIGKELTLAISDPTDIDLIDVVSSQTQCRVIPVISPYSEISRAIEKHYSKKVETKVSEIKKNSAITEISRMSLDNLMEAGTNLSVVKTVDRILIEAVQEGASDIHIEPRETSLAVRFRIDGILQEYSTFAFKMSPGIISRLKILSSLDISERQKPQDGRIQSRIDNKEIDIRVSTLPTNYGEKVVMRLLNRTSVQVKIRKLGFSKKNLTFFSDMITEPYGMMLVTGPTGSGKTTTLYAAINEINSVEVNIVTVEDPIEYQLPIINQVQVNNKKGLTFANALRSILRQDPDIVMIGEIRDPETASIAAEAALTGHLVLSTLHTNDSPSSITRLMDMGVAPFLLAPSLLGIIAQRLARSICPRCKVKYKPSKEEIYAVGLTLSTDRIKFHKGTGCSYCNNTGYKGRTGIHEILVIDNTIREMITREASVEVIREYAKKTGFKDMRFDGLQKVMKGIISTEELLRVTRDT